MCTSTDAMVAHVGTQLYTCSEGADSSKLQELGPLLNIFLKGSKQKVRKDKSGPP